MGHFNRTDEIPPTNLDTRNAHLSRNSVQQKLADEVGLVSARRSIGACRGLISETEIRFCLKCGQPIGPRKHPAGVVDDARTVRPDICTLFVKKIIVDAKQAALDRKSTRLNSSHAN